MKLQDAIKAVAPHATSDTTLQILTGVMIQDGYAVATDRYTAARVKITGTVTSMEYPTELDGTWISPAQIKAGVTDLDVNGQLILGNGARMDKAEAPGDYPTITRLFEAFEVAEEGTGFPSILFNQAFAKKFDSRHFPKGYAHSMKFEFDKRGVTKPVRVTFPSHEDFEALWVPIRETS